MKWTEAQRQTIETRDRNILVSAAAGSGKTAVLIERIKRLVIEEKTDIDRFLITTFTNAASAEMKSRLEKAVRAQMEIPGADRKFLARQLMLMPKANISTFHSFALEVMRRYFYLTDIEPGFSIGDETDVSIMKNTSVDILFEKRFAEDYDAFSAFLKKYSGDRNDRKLKSDIISLYDEMRSIPSYMTWLDERTELLASDSPSEVLGLYDAIAEESRGSIKHAYEYYERACRELEEAGLEKLYSKACEDAGKIADILSRADTCGTSSGYIAECASFLGSMKFNQMRAGKDEKEDYALIKDTVSDLRKNGKKYLDALKKKYYQRSMEEYDRELKDGYEDTVYMKNLLREFEEIFSSAKKERNMIDFDDAMHYAIEILQDDVAASEYRERFRYIFIDEFQDSNMLQEAVISRIAGSNNVFMVGDVKQSIYKFRLAEPEIFRRKYAQYALESETDSIKIDLNNNFRSKKKVTDAVNRVFETLMDGYDGNARLRCSIDDKYPGIDPECHIIVDDGEEEKKPDHLPEEKVLLELIKGFEGREIYDVKKGCMRKVQYRDIVVLSRSRSSLGGLERFLNNEGIPSYADNTGGYFETAEVQIFVNLLRIIDNTRQDIPLISVMRSPVFDFSVNELAAVRIAHREGTFCDAVRDFEKNGSDPELCAKIKDMYERISFWKELRNTVPLEELTRILLYDTGYFDYCSGLPAGRQRISNLRLLVEKAGRFEQNDHSGLYGFISYIEAMKRNDISIGEAKTVGENENVVRIMTVHKSKGLEFPVVILTGAGRKIKAKGSGTSAVMHKDLALAMPCVNREEKWHRKTLLQRVIESRKAGEEYEEEIRILYVAMTRAMDALAVTGKVKDMDKLERDIGRKGSYLEMMYTQLSEGGAEIIVHDASDDRRYSRTLAENRAGAAEIFARIRSCRNEDMIREIDRIFSFEYPYKDLTGVKSKYYVTELNRLQKQESVKTSEALRIAHPDFFEEKTGTGAAYAGTLMHLVMEKSDFARAAAEGTDYIRSVISELVSDGTVSREDASLLDPEGISAFFDSETGKRAAKAPVLYKEREFIMKREVEGAEVIVQGIIDCYFEDRDGLVLIDYKNSHAAEYMPEEHIVERYRGQLEEYADALGQAYGKAVSEAYLYIFNMKKFIRVEI